MKIDCRDLYPSRCHPYPDNLTRVDPVVHGTWGPDAPLTADQTNFYEDNGYLVLEGFLSDGQLDALQKEKGSLADNQNILQKDIAITEPASGALRSIFQIHEESTLFLDLFRDDQILRIAEYLLNDRVYVHQSRLNYKPAFRGKEFYWHSDFETWHVEDGMPRMRSLSMSITLSENTEFNGPLMIIPGSHKHFIACVGETPEDHYKQSLKKQDYGIPDDGSLSMLVEQGGIVAPKGPPGSLIIFDCNVMHGSNSNITPLPRSNVFVVYNSVTNRLRNPYGVSTPRPEFIAARNNIRPLMRKEAVV